MAERRAPVPVDLKRSWVLRQPLSLALDGVTLKEALAEISRQARLNLVYADDDLPIAATVNLRADRITVAAALTDVLLDAGVGYGEKRREDLTGAVGTVSSQALESRPITNTLSALQGALPGLIVQRSGGQPGVEDFDLNLRGVSSANGGNTPLVLIDGVPGNL